MKQKDTQMRLILAIVLMYSGNLNIATKKTKVSPFGWTIDPQILLNTRNRDDFRRKMAEVLTYFRVNFTEIRQSKTLLISSYKEIMRISNEIAILQEQVKGVFTKPFDIEWSTFLSIIHLYGEEKHHQKKTFLEILDMRTVFMPRALSRLEFVEKHFGGSND